MPNKCLVAGRSSAITSRLEKALAAHFPEVAVGALRDIASAQKRMRGGWKPSTNAWVIDLDDDPAGVMLVESLHVSDGGHHMMVCTEDREKALLAFHSGAAVCLLLPCGDACLVNALDHLLRGDIFLGAGVVKAHTSLLLNGELHGGLPPANGLLTRRDPVGKALTLDAKTRLKTLTDREKQIVQLIKSGLSTKEIAAKLSISAYTVSTHTKHVYRKLGVSSRPHLRKLY